MEINGRKYTVLTTNLLTVMYLDYIRKKTKRIVLVEQPLYVLLKALDQQLTRAYT